MISRIAANQPAQVTVPNDKEALEDLIRSVERARGSRVLIYWLSDMAKISEGAVPSLYDCLEAIGPMDRLDLILHTRGGEAEVPWRMVSLIREYAKHFTVIVPYRAASAGTILALGADEIVMTRLGSLGPIDPSRTHPLLPRREGERESDPISVQDMRHAMQFIREPTGPGHEMVYTPEAMAVIFGQLFDKLHPLVIGAIEQSYALAKLVGKRCLATHMDPATSQPQIDAIVDRLCDDYKSHQYQIARVEAKAIGLNVINASEDLERTLASLVKLFALRPLLPEGPPVAGKSLRTHLAWLDSTSTHLRVEGDNDVREGGVVVPKGDRWVAY